jgi:RNA polymerase sigma-70 factor (ECF subfamily)
VSGLTSAPTRTVRLADGAAAVERRPDRPARVQAGDPAAERIRAIYRAHAEPLYRFLVRLTLGDRETARDLLQETLLRAWRHLDRLPTDLESVRPWLFTVARNHAIDVARARRVRPAEVGMPDMTRVPTPTDPVERLLTAATVRRALLELSPEHRNVLVELYLLGATAAQAATRIGVPEGTIKSRAHYALRALRAAIGPTGA